METEVFKLFILQWQRWNSSACTPESHRKT